MFLEVGSDGGENMISKTAEEALDSFVVPIMLGDGFSARMAAARLYFKFGVQSVICDEKQSRWRFLIGFGGFYKIIKSSEKRLIVEELYHIADASGGGSLFLTPCGSEFSRVVYDPDVIDSLELRFTVAKVGDLIRKIDPDN